MADAEILKLPGIDTAPDTYETGGGATLENAKGRSTVDLDEFGDALDIEEAKQRFGRNRTLQTPPGNAADVVQALGEWARGGTGRETQSQRLARLRAEIADMQRQVDVPASNDPNGAGDGGGDEDELSCAEVAAQLRELNENLHSIEQSIASHKGRAPTSGLPALIANQIKSSQKVDTSAAATGLAAVEQSSKEGLTYELYRQPTEARVVALDGRIAELERRLAACENAVGADAHAILTDISASLGLPSNASASLRSVVSQVAQRLTLLDERSISALEGRLTSLAESAKSASDSNALSADLADLYTLVKRWDPLTHAIPPLLVRLQSLQSLHESAAAFAASLSSLKHRHDAIDASLLAQAKLLKQLSVAMDENMGVITKNFSSLEKRLDRLQ